MKKQWGSSFISVTFFPMSCFQSVFLFTDCTMYVSVKESNTFLNEDTMNVLFYCCD